MPQYPEVEPRAHAVPVSLPDGNTSCVVRGTTEGEMRASAINYARTRASSEPMSGSLSALAEFGPGGATLSQWERAVGRANDTCYKSRDRLVRGRQSAFRQGDRPVRRRGARRRPRSRTGPEWIEIGRGPGS